MGDYITRQQQESQGLLPQRRTSNFVSMPQAQHVEQFRPHQVDLAITHPATQEVIVTTSATDRARGFQLIIGPISIVVAIMAVLVSFLFDNELFSLATLLIFWISFCVVYVAGWVLTAVATPEFVSWYSARRQWNVIEREQVERWNHYKWQSGRAEQPSGRVVRIGDVEMPIGFAYAVVGLVGLLSITVGLLYLVGV